MWYTLGLNNILKTYENRWTKKPSVFNYRADDGWSLEWQHRGVTCVVFYPPDDEQDFGELLFHEVRSNVIFTVDEKIKDEQTLINCFNETILPALADIDILIKPLLTKFLLLYCFNNYVVTDIIHVIQQHWVNVEMYLFL